MALTSIPASLSATALTLTTAAQPNITSVGTLTGLAVSGNIAGTLTTAGQTNITSVGTLTALTVSGITDTVNFKVSGAQGSDGQVLTSTGSGVGWENIPAGGVNGIGTSTTTQIITLSSGNKVGIGENVGNASATLHVYSGHSDMFKVQSTGNYGMLMNNYGWLAIQHFSPTTALDITWDNNTVYNATTSNTQREKGGILVSNTNNNTNTIAGIALSTGSASNFGLWEIFALRQADKNSDLVFTGRKTNGDLAERLRIESDTGNVGIGVTPTFTPGGSRQLLQITNGANGANISMGNNASEAENPRIFSDADNLGFATATTGGGLMQFYTGGQEAYRITAARDMYFGQTSGSAANVGHIMQNNGVMFHTADNKNIMYLRRLTSDGSILEFRKDGNGIGTIGAYNSANYIQSGFQASYTGLYFNTNKIEPVGQASGDIRADASVDLGSSGNRFKDIFLSGGVNFSANSNATGMSSEILDDYEEGTWTPVLSGGTTAGSFTAGSGTAAKYIKVGDLVHYIIAFRNCTLSGASGTIKITGLPFTTNTGALYPVGSALMSHAFNFDHTHQQAFYAGGSVIYGLESRSGTSWVDWNVTNSAGLYLHLSFTHVSF